jgi:hypothetical protein
LISWILASPSPSGPSRSRNCSTVVGSERLAFTRVPLSKSIPKLRPFPAIAKAPTRRITPDIAKKYRLFPMKSKFQRSCRRPAPSIIGLRRRRERPIVPSTA